MHQMEGHFKGFSKLVIYHSCRFQRRENALKRPESLSKSYTGKTKKSGIIIEVIFPLFFEPITARNGCHCQSLDNDSARGYSDAVIGDSFANERTIQSVPS